jgi:NAD(P)H-dependent FMN reductase
MDSTEPLRVAVVIGSNREGRFGDTVAHWFIRTITTIDGIDLDTIDLADLDLSTSIRSTPSPRIRAISARVAEADAFVFITPEYNHSYPASMKAFIDHNVEEWCGKAVGFVSYGGIAGGLRSVEALRLVFASLNAVTVRNTVSFANAWNQFFDGTPIDEGSSAAAAVSLVNQIKWWGHALRQARRGAPLLTGRE